MTVMLDYAISVQPRNSLYATPSFAQDVTYNGRWTPPYCNVLRDSKYADKCEISLKRTKLHVFESSVEREREGGREGRMERERGMLLFSTLYRKLIICRLERDTSQETASYL